MGVQVALPNGNLRDGVGDIVQAPVGIGATPDKIRDVRQTLVVRDPVPG